MGGKSMRVYSYIADNCVVRREKLRFLIGPGGVALFRDTASVDNWFRTLRGHYIVRSRSRWPRGRLTAEIVDCGCWSLVFVVWCVGIGLCDELTTRWKESYRVCVYVCVRARVRGLIVSDLEIWTMRRPRPELRSFPREISTLPRSVRNLFAEDQLHSLLNTEILWECKILKATVGISVYQILYVNN
jgi:hypothetical protein